MRALCVDSLHLYADCRPYSRFVCQRAQFFPVCPSRACKVRNQRVEQDPHSLLERRPHGLLRAGVFVLGHRLRRDDEQVVGAARQLRLRLRGDHENSRPGSAGDTGQRLHRGEIPRPAGHQEQITRAHRRRGHVADDGHAQPQVHEPHGEAAHDQPFASQAVDDDPARAAMASSRLSTCAWSTCPRTRSTSARIVFACVYIAHPDFIDLHAVTTLLPQEAADGGGYPGGTPIH